MAYCQITNSHWECGHHDCQAEESFVESKGWIRLRAVFWTVYIVVPLLTGLLAYHWLPNESYEPDSHYLLDSHEVEASQDHFVEHPDVWQDKSTGTIYTYQSFAKHRHSEAIRMAVVWFAYGLVGCAFFSYVSSHKRQIPFSRVFTKAILVNLALATWTFVQTWY